MINDAPAAFADHAFAVGVIDHEHDIILAGDCVDLVQGGDVAVHGEDAIGDAQGTAVGAFIFFNLCLQVCGIGMGETHDAGAGQARAVDDAGVIQFVGEDDIFLADQGRDGGAVGAETGLEGDGGFNALEGSDAPFQFLVQADGTGDGTHRARSDAVLIDGVLGRLAHAGIVRQSKIVV